MNELDERRLQVVAEQAAGLRWQILLTASVVAAIAWRHAPTAWVVLWFVLVVVSREWRAARLLRMQADRTRPIAERLRDTVRSNVVIGLANGSAASFMWWLDPTLDAVLTMILVSWGAGAVSTSATVMPAFMAYASLLFVPTAVMWLAGGSWPGFGVAVLVLMFFGVQTRFARRNMQTFEESFRIRLENEALREAAEKANLEKSRFLAAASHDLRQPLQAMTLDSGELLRLPLEPAAHAIARDIASGVELLRTMLDALLEASKLDAGAVVPAPRTFELARLLEGLAHGFRAGASAQGVQLHWQCPPDARVHTDPALLRRMLSNLLDNAIKFSPAGTTVEIEATPAGDDIAIVVRDRGPGIAAEDHARIFEDMVQLPDERGVAPRGHGLGLGIVRRLADLLHAQLALDSAPGRGAAFTLRLPRASGQPSPAPAQSAPASPALNGCRVLVLDDDRMVRGAYVNALGGLGCRVWCAGTIAEAQAQAAQCDPQAAVIDCRLGAGEDGFAALQRLRAERPQMAAVMVTAHADAATVERAKRHAISLLHKPVDATTLSAALTAALQGG